MGNGTAERIKKDKGHAMLFQLCIYASQFAQLVAKITERCETTPPSVLHAKAHEEFEALIMPEAMRDYISQVCAEHGRTLKLSIRDLEEPCQDRHRGRPGFWRDELDDEASVSDILAKSAEALGPLKTTMIKDRLGSTRKDWPVENVLMHG